MIQILNRAAVAAFVVGLLMLGAGTTMAAELVENFVPTADPVTPGSACGAVAVGDTATGRVRGQHRDVENRFGQRVNSAGAWEYCDLTPDCRSSTLNTVRDTDRYKTVYNFMPAALPDAFIGDGKESEARVKIYKTVKGASGRTERIIRGHAVLVCDGRGNPGVLGGWTLQRAAVPWGPGAMGAPAK